MQVHHWAQAGLAQQGKLHRCRDFAGMKLRLYQAVVQSLGPRQAPLANQKMVAWLGCQAWQPCLVVKELKQAWLSWEGMAGAQTLHAWSWRAEEVLCKFSCPAMPSSPLGSCVMSAVHPCTCALELKLAQHSLGSFINAESIQA